MTPRRSPVVLVHVLEGFRVLPRPRSSGTIYTFYTSRIIGILTIMRNDVVVLEGYSVVRALLNKQHISTALATYSCGIVLSEHS